MFQRIQTIYLFVAVILSVILFCLPVTGGAIREMLAACASGGIFTIAAILPLLYFALVAIGGVLLPLITIFGYRHRPRQIGWCHVAMWLIVISIVVKACCEFFVQSDATAFSAAGWLTGIVPLFDLIFIGLAARAVRRDERLVRAADRIR